MTLCVLRHLEDLRQLIDFSCGGPGRAGFRLTLPKTCYGRGERNASSRPQKLTLRGRITGKFSINFAAASIIAWAILGALEPSTRNDRPGDIINVALAAEMSVVTSTSCKVDGPPSTVGRVLTKGPERRMTPSLYDKVRTSSNMFAAWRHVKKSALRSSNKKIRGHASEFEHHHQTHIKTLQTQLRKNRFKFDDVEGVLKDKKIRESQGKNPRPIAIGTIRNRVVQRAILQVLQPRKVIDPENPNSKFKPLQDDRLGLLNAVNTSKYGIGGLMAPYGGVKPGIELIMSAMASGATHYFQSDIKAFFTDIPVNDVVNIISAQTKDEELSNLFASALEVNLANKEELLGYADIFPASGIGVAQGSSLSAFAGNVLLYELDQELNRMDVTAVRYIDDIFILGPTYTAVEAAKHYAKAELARFKFSLYAPTANSTKAAEGECKNGFTFLGCSIQPNKCVPSVGSKEKVLSDVRETISKSKRSIIGLTQGNSNFDPQHSQSATIDRLGRKLYGWQKSFSFCTAGQVFAEVDSKVQEQIFDYTHSVHRIIQKSNPETQMRALGIPSLEKMFLNDRASGKS
jgi:hypothetical protein